MSSGQHPIRWRSNYVSTPTVGDMLVLTRPLLARGGLTRC